MPHRVVHAVVLLVLTFAVAGCDQVTKDMARTALEPYTSTSYAGGALELLLVENRGGFLSLGDRMPEPVRLLIFRWMVPGLLILLVFRTWSGSSRFQTVGLALVLGGGLGNWVDRWSAEGAVTDFLRLGVGPFQTGIFNVADVALVLGLALLVLPVSSHERESVEAGEEPEPLA